MDIGSLNDLLGRVLRANDKRPDGGLDGLGEPLSAEVKVIADYASEDLLVGALRHFHLVRDKARGTWRLQPMQVETTQIRSRSARKRIAEDLRAEL